MLCPPLRASLRVFAASREELRFSEHGRSQRGSSGGIPGAVSPVPPATQCVQGSPLGTVGLTRRREDAKGNAGGRCKVSDRRGGICCQYPVCFTMLCPPLRASLRVFAASREELRFSEHGRSQRGWSGGDSGCCVPGTPCHAVRAGEACGDCWAHAKPRRRERKRRRPMQGVSPASVVCPRFRWCVPGVGGVSPASRGSQWCVPHFASSRLRVRYRDSMSTGYASVPREG
jgi:hypothetical protein